MAYIKVQKLKKDDDGQVISGSASIIETQYVSTGKKNHSRQRVRESLGKIIEISEDHKQGIFQSKERGLVHYDVTTDTFTQVDADDDRIRHSAKYQAPEIHTVFGDSYLLLQFMKQIGILDIIETAFPDLEKRERVLCHILHGILKDGSHIGCDDFIENSFVSHIFDKILVSTLHSDSRFFQFMGSDRIKMAFFQAFVRQMRKENPRFGKGCYVDSTPLPNDMKNNPFNALCCHGLRGSEVQLRMVLVLDEETELPVWYDIIPGNVVDMNTLMEVTEDVASSLEIEIDSYVLDVGYLTEEIVKAIHIGKEKSLIAKMPARRGYPYKALYRGLKDEIVHARNDFVRNGNPYFGVKKKINLFDCPEFAYVYVDRFNALSKYRTYMLDHPEDYEKLSDYDKDWYSVKNGFFVLISNVDSTPEKILDHYFDRTHIEGVFKSTKEYLNLLPISKWENKSVRGKILYDMIEEIIFIKMRKVTVPSGYSTSKIIAQTQSLMCFRDKNGGLRVSTPRKQVKDFYKLFKIPIPSHLGIEDIKKELHLLM